MVIDLLALVAIYSKFYHEKCQTQKRLDIDYSFTTGKNILKYIIMFYEISAEYPAFQRGDEY
jgi:hypothetical protein